MTVRELRNQYNLNYIKIRESMVEANKEGIKRKLSVFNEFEEKMHRITKASFDKDGIMNRGSASRFTKTQLLKAIYLQDVFLSNSLASKEGRQSIIDKSYHSFVSNNPAHVGISPDKFLQMIDIMQSESLSMLFDVKNISSDVVLNLIRDRSASTVVSILNEVVNLTNINELSRFEIAREIYDRMRKL